MRLQPSDVYYGDRFIDTLNSEVVTARFVSGTCVITTDDRVIPLDDIGAVWGPEETIPADELIANGIDPCSQE